MRKTPVMRFYDWKNFSNFVTNAVYVNFSHCHKNGIS